VCYGVVEGGEIGTGKGSKKSRSPSNLTLATLSRTFRAESENYSLQHRNTLKLLIENLEST